MAAVEDSLRGARPVQGGELNDWKISLQPVSLWPPTPQRRVAGFANCRGAGRGAGLAVVGVAGFSPGMASGLARPRPFQAPLTLSGPFGWRIGAGALGSQIPWGCLDIQGGQKRMEPTLCLRCATTVISAGSRPRPPCVQKLQAPPPGKMWTSKSGVHRVLWSPWQCRFPILNADRQPNTTV